MEKSSFGSEEKGVRDSQITGAVNKNTVVVDSSTRKSKSAPESQEQKIVISNNSIGKRNKPASTEDTIVSHSKTTEKGEKWGKSKTDKTKIGRPSKIKIWGEVNVFVQKILAVLTSFKGKIREKTGLTDKKQGPTNKKMIGGESILIKRSKKSICIGLGVCGGCAVIIVVFFSLLWGPDSGSNQKLKLKEGDVYYTSTVTKVEAEMLGNYLVRTDFFSGASRSILYNKNGNINEFKMNIKDGAVIKPIDPDVCRQITRDLSQKVFRGAHVNVHLTDAKFNTIWVINQAPSFGEKMVFNGANLYYTSTITPEVATRFGNYLVKNKFYDGSPKSTLLNRVDDIYEFKMVVEKGAENDPNTLAAGTQMIQELSSELFHGSHVNIYLTDNEFKTLKVLVQKADSGDKSEGSFVAGETSLEEDIFNGENDKVKTADSVDVNELENKLRSYDPVERGLAAVSLGEAGSQAVSAVDALIRLLVDYAKLTKKGPYEGKWPVYVDGDVELDEHPSNIDKVAAWSLSKIGGVAVEPLAAALDHDDWRVQRYAAKILGKIGSSRAEEALIVALYDENWLVQEDAISALKKITGKDGTEWQRGKVTIDPLISALDEENVRVKWDVIKALGKLKDPRALDPLVAILNQKYGDPLLQERVLRTIGELHDNRAVTPLIAILDDKDVSTSLQELAVKILGELNDSRGVEAIIVAMENPHIKDEAAVALRNLTGENFGEDVTRWHKWNQQSKSVEIEKRNYANGIHSDSTSEDSVAFNEIVKVHPDYLEVLENQMFTDYVNNLPPQKYKVARRIVESGSIEQVNKLISVYKNQVDNQQLHRLMIKEMIASYIDPERKDRVDSVVQDWVRESGDFRTMVKWNVKKIYEENFVVDYVVDGDSYEQKFLFEVDLSSNAINRTWKQDSSKLPNEVAIMMVKESYILDHQNKTKTKHVIMNKKDEIRGEYKLIGWRSKRIDGQTFLVSYSYEKDLQEHGWFFEVNLDTSLIRRKNPEFAMNGRTH
ncbi:MAG: HEAT repeat domain-containing protein [Candidatus Scalindua sp. AMX11]|nr:MAG: HEAT repeat domain-containing protein [Candidatus Scalindua sp.]NOG83833.1 HEAT repeat domain-containing protein [Planctomycetota bacterium]RZV82985.1 MAG: HEAT repeat domain-containing protein [Candidatus Scalindua sp. SCAELEC01]TDE64487.1 MAG: HEAT repeat domain-containing protein [Candidatus Scalindua sp. AMX11]GJQ58771.1 MAG: hypothetical protein SCALA701_15720 [Candidatus Scalindua sp.]